jgi:hypothetical protein
MSKDEMDSAEETAELLAQLKADQKCGVHPCCGWLLTGPHSKECSVEHPWSYSDTVESE